MKISLKEFKNTLNEIDSNLIKHLYSHEYECWLYDFYEIDYNQCVKSDNNLFPNCKHFYTFKNCTNFFYLKKLQKIIDCGFKIFEFSKSGQLYLAVDARDKIKDIIEYENKCLSKLMELNILEE